MENRVAQSKNALSQKVVLDKHDQRLLECSSYDNRYRMQQTMFLKKEIQKIMNYQIKVVKATQKLKKDLEDYDKENGDQIILLNNNINKLKQLKMNEKNENEKRFQTYRKLALRKEEQLEKQRKVNEEKLLLKRQTRTRREQIYQKKKEQREENALTRSLMYLQNMHQRGIKTKNLKSVRKLRSAKIVSLKNSLTQKNEEESLQKIKNFISKMKKIQQISLKQDLKREKARQSYCRCDSVRTFVKERTSKEMQRMQSFEKRYEQRMSHFETNYEKVQNKTTTQLYYKSVARNNSRLRALQKKDNLYDSFIQRIREKMQTKIIKTENNSKNKLKKTQDFRNCRLIYKHNLSKLKEMKKQQKHQQNMKYLYEKVKKLKEIQNEDELTKREKIALTKFLNKNDQQYKELKAFIEGSKRTYIQNLQAKQEENKKLRK